MEPVLNIFIMNFTSYPAKINLTLMGNKQVKLLLYFKILTKFEIINLSLSPTTIRIVDLVYVL